MGPVRSFYVDLYRKIKTKDHKDKYGRYLDTAYDEAMQYPLFEMARLNHIEYVPEICYFYNNNYGNNDHSTPAKNKHRNKVKFEITTR